jgi:hypothetical protein
MNLFPNLNLNLNYLISIMGGIFVLLGIFIRLGHMKQVYWKSPRSMVGYIPLGFVFALAGFYEPASKAAPTMFYAYLGLFAIVVGLTLYFAIRPPKFIKPAWVLWVEKHPHAVQKAMAADTENNENWKQNVTSEAAVNSWAKQLGRKLPKKK